MRKSIVAILFRIFLALVCVGVVLAVATLIWVRTWKTAYSPDGRLSIKYPSSWFVRNNAGSTVMLDKNDFGSAKFSDWKSTLIATLFHPDNFPSELTNNEAAHRSAIHDYRYYLDTFPEQATSIREITSANHKAFLVNSVSLTYALKYFIVADSGKLYDINWQIKFTPNWLNSFIKQFIAELMLQTIRFSGQQ